MISDLEKEIFLKLLDAEISRGNTLEDIDDRQEALAKVSEGSDVVIERIRSGMKKYKELLEGKPLQEVKVVETSNGFLRAVRSILTRNRVSPSVLQNYDSMTAELRETPENQNYEFTIRLKIPAYALLSAPGEAAEAEYRNRYEL